MSATRTALGALREQPGVLRAWPGRDGELVFEALDGNGALRAGRIDESGSSALVPFARDPKLPGLAPPAEGRLVVHRLNRRAVVLLADRAVKLLRPGRGQAVADASRRMGRIGLRAGFATAGVLVASGTRVDFSLLPGRTLHELGDEGGRAWGRFGELWPLLALAPHRSGLSEHGPAEEAGVLRNWLGHVQRFQALPEPRLLARAVERVCGMLLDGGDPLVVSHRDLHDKQLLWDGDRLGLLDLDTAALAEAALDLANLRAHLELRRVQGLLSPAARDRAIGRLEEAAGRLPVRSERFAAALRASRLRIAMVYAFRPAARSWLPAWTEHCLRDAEASAKETEPLEWST